MQMPFENGLETKLGTLVYLRASGKTLMLLRDQDPTDFMYGMHVAPGGKLEPGESPEDGAIRECFEETDIQLTKPLINRGRVFFDNKNRNFRGKPATFNFLVYLFEARTYSGTPKRKLAGSPIWVPDNEIRALKMEKGDSMVLDWIDAGIPINYRIILTDTSSSYVSL